ncbi:MAG: hypothetical protein JKY59_03045, partial [Emcibacter sp.]|nr:hypothetical protein [Emcibacter sp.]
WISLISHACACQEIRSPTPPKMLAYSILGLCNSLSSWYRPDGELSLEQIARHFTNIILDGIETA